MEYWEKEPGEKSKENWFKRHPKTTLLILLDIILLLITIST